MGGEGEGIATYYQRKIDEHEIILHEKTTNLRRLEAQRNELNARGSLCCCPIELLFLVSVRRLKDEVVVLQEPGAYVGEVIKVMGKTRVLVKVREKVVHDL
jgi:26S proteasome regulatory subunit T6